MNYTITDSNGNSVTKTRDVTVVIDDIAPIIILNPTQEKYNLGANPAELFVETGYTVTDNYSPQEDIDIDIKYFSITNDPNHYNQPEFGVEISNIADETLPLGFYKIVYTAKDSSNNTTQAFRLIEYIDETRTYYYIKCADTNKYDIGADPIELFIERRYIKSMTIIGNLRMLQLLSKISQLQNHLITINHSLDNLLQIWQMKQGLGFYKVVYTATDD